MYNSYENNNVSETKEASSIVKIELKDFKLMSDEAKVKYINQYTDGEKNLKDIEKEYFSFTNISAYIDKNYAYWDKGSKKMVLRQSSVISESREELLSFLEENQDILKSLLAKQKYTNISSIEGQKVVSKSFKVGQDTWEKFSSYCDANDLKRSVILTNLIENFLDNL